MLKITNYLYVGWFVVKLKPQVSFRAGQLFLLMRWSPPQFMHFDVPWDCLTIDTPNWGVCPFIVCRVCM